MSFEATFDDKQLRKFLKEITARTKDVVETRNRYAGLISVLVFRDVIEHFEKEQGSKGPWAALSSKYERRRQPGKILQISGKLRQSFAPTNWKSTSEGLFWFNNAQTSSGFPYAYAHDTGGKTLPKRDFMWLSAIALERISEQTLRFMVDEDV